MKTREVKRRKLKEQYVKKHIFFALYAFKCLYTVIAC